MNAVIVPAKRVIPEIESLPSGLRFLLMAVKSRKGILNKRLDQCSNENHYCLFCEYKFTCELLYQARLKNRWLMEKENDD